MGREESELEKHVFCEAGLRSRVLVWTKRLFRTLCAAVLPLGINGSRVETWEIDEIQGTSGHCHIWFHSSPAAKHLHAQSELSCEQMKC